MNKRQIGKFSIDRDILDKILNGEILHFEDILKHFIIVKAEMDFASNSVEYYAYSNLFEELNIGHIVPYYTLYLTPYLSEDKMKVIYVLRKVEKRD